MPDPVQLDNTQYRYTPNSGKHATSVDIRCGVCGDMMNKVFNRTGPRSSVGAMAGIESSFDEYICPHADIDWHKQVVALRKEAQATASEHLEAALLAEADEIAKNREATKKNFRRKLS